LFSTSSDFREEGGAWCFCLFEGGAILTYSIIDFCVSAGGGGKEKEGKWPFWHSLKEGSPLLCKGMEGCGTTGGSNFKKKGEGERKITYRRCGGLSPHQRSLLPFSIKGLHLTGGEQKKVKKKKALPLFREERIGRGGEGRRLEYSQRKENSIPAGWGGGGGERSFLESSGNGHDFRETGKREKEKGGGGPPSTSGRLGVSRSWRRKGGSTEYDVRMKRVGLGGRGGGGRGKSLLRSERGREGSERYGCISTLLWHLALIKRENGSFSFIQIPREKEGEKGGEANRVFRKATTLSGVH